MAAAFAQTGSDRSASIMGASDVSMRTALTLGRMNGGGETAAPIGDAAEAGAAAATSVNPSGAAAGIGAAIATRHEHASASATNGALAPDAKLLTRNLPPQYICGLNIGCRA
jgi:hypothetical protein